MTHPSTETVTATLLAEAAAALLRAVAVATTDPTRIGHACRALDIASGALTLHTAELWGDPLSAEAIAAELAAAVPELLALAERTTTPTAEGWGKR